MAPKKKSSKKSSKKKKKNTDSKQDLETQAELFMQSENLHKMFIDRISSWLLSHFGRVIDIFRKFDKNGDGMLSYEEFFAGMSDLQAPCNKLELYVLAKTVDKNLDGNIEYNEFSQGIKYRRPIKVEIDDGLPVLKIAREHYEKCPCCLIKKWDYKERHKKFVSLDLILDSMKTISDFPGHIRSLVVHSDMTIYGILEKIFSAYGHALKDVIVFHIVDGCRVILDFSYTLESVGFKGGSEEEPTEVCLYYEFGTNKSIDCPILQSDHYFDRKKHSGQKGIT